MDKILDKQVKNDSTNQLESNIISLIDILKNQAIQNRSTRVINSPGTILPFPSVRAENVTQLPIGESTANVATQYSESNQSKQRVTPPGPIKTGFDQFLKDLKKQFTIEGFFDLGEGKSQGLLGNILRNVVAENKYINDQIKQTDVSKQVQYQGPDGTKKLREDLRNQYRQDQFYQNTTGNLSNITEGNTSNNTASLANIENKILSTSQNNTKLSGEQQAESLKLIAEQQETFQNIEKNTSVLPEAVVLLQKIQQKLSTQDQVQQSTQSTGPGLLGSIPDFLGKPSPKQTGKKSILSRGAQLAKAGKNYVGKLGGVTKLAKGLGIGAAATVAGEGLIAGGEGLKESGYENTGKAVGVVGSAAKYAGYGAMAGSFIPGVGTAIGAGVGGLVGAGVGIYDQYFADDEDKAKIIDKGGSATIPGLGNITHSTDGKNYFINNKSVDKTTYQEYVTLRNALFNPKSNPEYKTIYEKAVQSANNQGKTGLDATWEAEAVVEKAIVPKITKIVSSVEGLQSNNTPPQQVSPISSQSVVNSNQSSMQVDNSTQLGSIQNIGNNRTQGVNNVTQLNTISQATPNQISPVKSVGGMYGEAVYKASGDNAMSASQAQNERQQPPVIVNAPSTNVNNMSTVASGPPMARNNESSVLQYNRSKFF